MKYVHHALPIATLLLIASAGLFVSSANPVHAAVLSTGGLIRAEGSSAVYFYGADGKRYVFPNETTYFSWYSDFSNISVLSPEEMSGFFIGGNVTIRAGAKLVKITTDPNVYAVMPMGILARIPDEETASALYGNDWAKRVVDIPDAFFVDYDLGSALTGTSTYPAGSLIRKPDAQGIYYINLDGTARKFISEEAFLANGFKKSDVVMTSDTYELPEAGLDITGMEEEFVYSYPIPLVLKPAIYLYPVREQKTLVQLEYDGDIVADDPEYDPSVNGWNVTAYPNGRLRIDGDDKDYDYLFWEGRPSKPPAYDLSSGFVVKGEDVDAFLRRTLEEIGLTPNEINEFIVYWYPKMKDNPYNLVHFAGRAYTDTARLTITPQPDAILRVFMVVRPLAEPIGMKPQTFKPFVRNGFTVVEWGGSVVR